MGIINGRYINSLIVPFSANESYNIGPKLSIIRRRTNAFIYKTNWLVIFFIFFSQFWFIIPNFIVCLDFNLIPVSPFLMPYLHQPPSIFPNNFFWKGYQFKLKTPIPKQIRLEIHPESSMNVNHDVKVTNDP